MLVVHSAEAKIAAVLHDVVEDTPWTIAQLRDQGFSNAVLDAIAALTKGKGKSRIDAALQAVKNPIARAAKLAASRI